MAILAFKISRRRSGSVGAESRRLSKKVSAIPEVHCFIWRSSICRRVFGHVGTSPGRRSEANRGLEFLDIINEL
jgi:hypothetical protein